MQAGVAMVVFASRAAAGRRKLGMLVSFEQLLHWPLLLSASAYDLPPISCSALAARSISALIRMQGKIPAEIAGLLAGNTKAGAI
jgi:hypothetical protein